MTQKLNDKWWYRLLKIFFLFSTPLVFLMSALELNEHKSASVYNHTISEDLLSFSQRIGKPSSEVINEFNYIDGDFACYNSFQKKVTFIKDRSEAMRLLSCIDEHSKEYPEAYKSLGANTFKTKLNPDQYLRVNNTQNTVYQIPEPLELIDLDIPAKCEQLFLQTCSPSDLVMVKPNWFYYVQPYLFAFGITGLWILILLSLRRIFTYVVYGSQKKS